MQHGGSTDEPTARHRALRFAASASQLLSASLDLPATLSQLTRLAVPMLGTCCMVDLLSVDATKRPELAALSCADDTLTPALLELRRAPDDALEPLLERVVQGRQVEFVAQLSADGLEAHLGPEGAAQVARLRRLGLTALFAVPLIGRQGVLGVLTVAGGPLDDDTRVLAVDLAERAALAIDNARLFEASRAAVRERDEALARAREAETRLQTVLDHAPAAIYIKDLEGRYQLANRRCAAIFGREPAAMLGHDDAALLPDQPEVARALREHDLTVLDHLATLEFEEPVTIDGKRHTWLSQKFPLLDTQGHPHAVCGISTDITERQQLAEARERFVAIVGHDLRNPLSSITLAAALLLRSEGLDERQRRITTQVARSAERMIRLIEDLLDLTRGRLGGGIPVARSETNLAEVCRHVLDELQPTHPERTFALETDGDVRGQWDADRLEQVVSNLVSNALVHGRAEGPITLRLYGESQAVRLEVHNAADSCPPPERLETLFEPFKHAADGAQHVDPRHGGLGLGLYIAWEIVRSHGGRIGVHCNEDYGFEVDVWLPRDLDASESAPLH